MVLTLILIFLAVAAAYYFLGTPLLDYIHKFTQQFTHTFPLWAFFLGAPTISASPRGNARRRGRGSSAGDPEDPEPVTNRGDAPHTPACR